MTEVMESTGVTRLVSYSPKYRDQVIDLARLMHAESGAHFDIPFDESKLAAQFQGAVLMPDMIYLRLAVLGDEVIGGFFGVITEMFFSQERAAFDQGWYVKPAHRGGRATLLMIRDWERWGLERGVRKFNLSQTCDVKVGATRKLMEHLGYRIIGFNAIKEI